MYSFRTTQEPFILLVGCRLQHFCFLSNSHSPIFHSLSTDHCYKFLGKAMASIVANFSLPILMNATKPCLKPTFYFPVFANPGRQSRASIVVKAAGDSSDSSPSLSVVETVQNVWDKPEDRVAVIGLGLTAIIALWASTNLISAIDKLPVIPSFLEFIGILYSSWFVYSNLLFKPDREEFFRSINKSISNILGQ